MTQLRRIAGFVAVLTATSGAAVEAQLQMHTPTPAPYSSTVGAHGRFSKVRINLGQPDLALTAALIAAGGGSAQFDAQKFVGALAGNGPAAQTELAALTKRFGAANVTSFEKTFAFVVSDALAQASAAGIALPPTPVPNPADPKALAGALYAAGVPPRGRFDAEYMLDTLLSHVIHVAVMNDIEADPGLGPKADANYHAVLTGLMLDLKSADNLVPAADAH